MAIFNSPLLGKIKQSVGGTTFSTWKGINVAKSKPTSVANPNSEGQQDQRSRMTLLVSLYRSIQSAVGIGFRELAIGMSQYNAFVQANLLNGAVTASAGVATLVPDNLEISKGTLDPTQGLLVNINPANETIEITNPNQGYGNQSSTDRFAGLLVNSAGQVLDLNTDIGSRQDDDLMWVTNVNIVAGTYHVYVFTYSVISKKVEDSQHFEIAVV